MPPAPLWRGCWDHRRGQLAKARRQKGWGGGAWRGPAPPGRPGRGRQRSAPACSSACQTRTCPGTEWGQAVGRPRGGRSWAADGKQCAAAATAMRRHAQIPPRRSLTHTAQHCEGSGHDGPPSARGRQKSTAAAGRSAAAVRTHASAAAAAAALRCRMVCCKQGFVVAGLGKAQQAVCTRRGVRRQAATRAGTPMACVAGSCMPRPFRVRSWITTDCMVRLEEPQGAKEARSLQLQARPGPGRSHSRYTWVRRGQTPV